MRVIAYKRLKDYWNRYPEAEASLQHWCTVVENADWSTFSDVRNTFRSADQVGLGGGSIYIFDIGGNNHRMIAGINYETKIVYVKMIMTHADYDRGHWRTQVTVK